MLRVLFILLLLGSSSLSAQDKTIVLDFDESSLSEIIKSIESQGPWLFSYKDDDLDTKTISIQESSESIEYLLDIILIQNDFSYEIIGANHVIIQKAKKRKMSICGLILDNESGQVLPYANIRLQGLQKGTYTDEDGRFNYSFDSYKEPKIIISYIGYETITKEYSDLNKKDCPQILLSIPDYDEDFLIIKDYIIDGVDLTDNGAATTLNPKKIGSLPGAAEPDVLAIAQFLPGISSPSSKASDIRIRGCTPDQNLLIWENIPIYHAAHYFGMISAINPFIIEQMDIYRGGFGAEYGGRLAGVLDLKSGNEQLKEPFLGIGTNMTHSYIYGHQFLSKKIPSSINFSIRRSFDELLRTPTFRNIARINEQGLILGNKEVSILPDNITIEDDIHFGDANIKISSQFSEKDRVEISALYSQNNFLDRITDSKIGEFQVDTLLLSNIGLSSSFQHSWSSNIISSIKAIYTNYKYDYQYSLNSSADMMSISSGTKSNSILDRQLSLNTVFRNDRHQEWEIGYQLNNYHVDFTVIETKRNSPDIEDFGNTKSLLHTIYSSWKNPIDNKIGVNAGVRMSYFGVNNKIYWEPRMRLAYRLNDIISMHLNYGRHYQFISQVQEFRGNNNGINASLWALAELNKIPVQSADIYQLGSIIKKGSLVIDIQLYARNIQQLSSRAHNIEIVDRGQPIIGSAKIRGLDILIKKRYNNFKSWLSYSLSKTEFTFPGLSQAVFLSDFDQTHVLQWSNKVNIKSFEFSLGLQYASGLPYSEIIGYETSGEPMNPNISPLYSGINTERLDYQMELNISASYFVQLAKDKRFFISASVLNVLNKENIESRKYYIDSPNNMPPSIKIFDRRNLPITPNLSLRLEF